MGNISNFVKRIRDVMRNDAGINGDAQRIEQIAWMLFLKVYDSKEQDWMVTDSSYISIIPDDCRWCNWAHDDKSGKAMTGDTLLDFVNNKLFKELKSLLVTPDTPIRKSIVKTTFEDANNYMKDGVLLRQVINIIDELDLGDYEESHAFGEIYESILRELQSAGSAGEFYTPGIYGEQHWWPCKSGNRWEIVTGAILTQNCAWKNVEKALANLETAKLISPEAILQTPDEFLQEAVRSAGFFTQKTAYLKAVARFFLDNKQEFLQSDDVWTLRKQLLSVKGVGRETADAILLYAFHKPIFVIDAYARRVAERHLHLDGTIPYDDLQKTFMDALPPDIQLYGEYHALIIALCKESCLKSKCGATCGKLETE